MKITIFTPTYNRAYILSQLYESLQNQTSKNFEWLIVDDGSNDNTEELVSNWLKEKNHFNIQYLKKENGGKQRAINYGLQYAQGELFFNVDSDDYLANDAIEKIIKWEKNVPKSSKICCLAGSVGNLKNEAINPIFDKEYIDCSMLDRYPRKENNYLFIGHDRAWVFYTKVHKKYLYPEIKNEKFISEAVVWNRMAKDGYKVRCFNDVIYYLIHRNDGLTNNIRNIYIKNPYGYALWKNEMNEILYKSTKKRFLNDYSLFCDLVPFYSKQQILNFTNKSKKNIYFFDLLYKIKNLWR